MFDKACSEFTFGLSDVLFTTCVACVVVVFRPIKANVIVPLDKKKCGVI